MSALAIPIDALDQGNVSYLDYSQVVAAVGGNRIRLSALVAFRSET